MPRSPRKTAKTPARARKTPAKRNIEDAELDEPLTPLNDISNTILRPPPTTPRVIDFDRLELEDEGQGDGWSSDDSFEEKITWSRHRNRTGPRGVTPRNIQAVRRRLNLQELPEDKAANAETRPILLKLHAESSSRPSTPAKTFLAKDPSVLPPTPSPKKTPAANALNQTPTTITPTKPSLIFGPSIPGPLKRVVSPVKAPRPSTPTRRPVTEVKEFKFASDARIRRSPTKTQVPVSQPSKPSSPQRSSAQPKVRISHVDEMMEVEQNEIYEEAIDPGAALRMRAREMGTASILAWGETRGRYVE